MTASHPELDRIAAAYARRGVRPPSRYTAYVQLERERHYRELLLRLAPDLSQLTLVELGCGAGGELARLIQLGLSPDRIRGVELLEVRVAQARHRLPESVSVAHGDATQTGLRACTQDVVFISTVFSSILDPCFRSALAAEAWRIVRPGGAVLTYDFRVGNPRNRDVCGIPAAEFARLFPMARGHCRAITLAPPIGRAVAPLGPKVYRLLSSVPFLRTHLIGWFEKPFQPSTPGVPPCPP